MIQVQVIRNEEGLMSIQIGDTVIIHSQIGDPEIDALDGMQGRVVDRDYYHDDLVLVWVRVPEMGDEMYCLNESEVEAI
jgi:hypothetical protein